MNKRDYVKSSPHLFIRIKLALGVCIVVLLLLAVIFPAPLQVPADIARVPNPARSAWFLLWMQELVSYSGRMIYLILAIGASFLLLPFWPGQGNEDRAQWFARKRRWVNLLTLLLFVAIILLTLLAAYLRGENWAFTGLF